MVPGSLCARAPRNDNTDVPAGTLAPGSSLVTWVGPTPCFPPTPLCPGETWGSWEPPGQTLEGPGVAGTARFSHLPFNLSRPVWSVDI